jgi:hypothetical protein
MWSLITKICLISWAVGTSLNAETWVRGALMVHAVSGSVELSGMGEETIALNDEELPLSMSALLNARAPSGASLFLSTSNRGFIHFEGNGSFGIERFEHVLPEASAWASAEDEFGQSRTILNFREGHIFFDGRVFSETSQTIMETPLGQISTKHALMQMRIEFDPRSQVFNFTITCSEGLVRFTDLQGEHYSLRDGQRLSGAGARMTPSIEVGESSEEASEKMAHFLGLIRKHAEAATHFYRYAAHFQPIPGGGDEQSSGFNLRDSSSNRRPVVIEYAKDPAPVTPFRANIPPPAANKANHF